MPTRARVTVSMLAIAVAVAATACSAGGGNGDHSSGPPSPTLTRTVTETSTTPSPTPTVPPDAQLPESLELAKILTALPATGRPWYNSGPWPTEETPTLRQYTTRFYDPSVVSDRMQDLAENGINGIAHRTWVLPSGAQEDDVLVSFADTDGATSWFSEDTGEAPGGADFTTFTISGLPASAQVVAYRTSTPNSKGLIQVKVAAQRGPVVAFMFMFFPQTYDAATAQAWAAAQISRLPT